MQCPNCSSFLPPGSSECMQCGHRFTAARKSPVAVQPPRARWWQKRLRKIFGFYLLADELSHLKKKLRPDEWLVAMVCSVVPGLGHALYARKDKGLLLAGGWLAMLFAVVLLWGNMLAQLAVAGLLFVHLYAVLDAGLPFMREMTMGKRVKIFAAVSFILLACIYMPLHMTRKAIVEDVVIEYDTHSELFARGDILLVSKYFCKQDRLQRGDLVLFGINSQMLHLPREGRPAANIDNVYIPSMRVIDRILGVGGDTVTFAQDGIYVNGEKLSADLGPVNCLELPRGGSFIVPANRYLIYPSCLRVVYPDRVHEYPSAGIKLQQSIVPTSRIIGKIFMLYHPLGKRRFF